MNPIVELESFPQKAKSTPSVVAGQRFELPFKVGRCPQGVGDLQIEVEGFSRMHARFVVEGDQAVVEDLGSTQGLRVNGVRTQRHVLNEGDRVELPAGVVFRYPPQHGR